MTELLGEYLSLSSELDGDRRNKSFFVLFEGRHGAS